MNLKKINKLNVIFFRFIYLVPDISNVEHVEDETINPNRENKLLDIKNKYLNGKKSSFYI